MLFFVKRCPTLRAEQVRLDLRSYATQKWTGNAVLYGNFALRIYPHSPLENKLSDGFVWYANPLHLTQSAGARFDERTGHQHTENGNAVRGSSIIIKFRLLCKYYVTSPRYRNTSSATRRGMRTPCASVNTCKFVRADIAQVGSSLCGAQTKRNRHPLRSVCFFSLVTRTGIEPMFSA